jgi:acetoacetyl-CoA reductase
VQAGCTEPPFAKGLAKDGIMIAGCDHARLHQMDRRTKALLFIPRSVGNGDWDPTVAAFDKVMQLRTGQRVLVNNAGITRDGQFRKSKAGLGCRSRQT